MSLLDINDVILSNHHLVWPEINNILVIVLSLTEGIVLIDIFNIGVGTGAGHILLIGIIVHGRVAFRVIVEFIAVVNLYVIVVVIRTAEITEIVARRVFRSLLVSL